RRRYGRSLRRDARSAQSESRMTQNIRANSLKIGKIRFVRDVKNESLPLWNCSAAAFFTKKHAAAFQKQGMLHFAVWMCIISPVMQTLTA
ncbi:MAG: hypothetical protein ACI3XD_01560, partial [Oscillospiraceae bacterium]